MLLDLILGFKNYEVAARIGGTSGLDLYTRGGSKCDGFPRGGSLEDCLNYCATNALPSGCKKKSQKCTAAYYNPSGKKYCHLGASIQVTGDTGNNWIYRKIKEGNPYRFISEWINHI